MSHDLFLRYLRGVQVYAAERQIYWEILTIILKRILITLVISFSAVSGGAGGWSSGLWRWTLSALGSAVAMFGPQGPPYWQRPMVPGPAVSWPPAEGPGTLTNAQIHTHRYRVTSHIDTESQLKCFSSTRHLKFVVGQKNICAFDQWAPF